MNIRWTGNRYISDEGYEVELLGHYGVRYIDESKTVTFDTEILQGDEYLVLYGSSARLISGGTETAMPRDAISGVVQRIREAFRSQGFEIAVDWS